MARRREEQIFETSQNMRPDGIALVAGEQHANRTLAVKDVEVVQPKVDQYLLERFSGSNEFKSSRFSSLLPRTNVCLCCGVTKVFSGAGGSIFLTAATPGLS